MDISIQLLHIDYGTFSAEFFKPESLDGINKYQYVTGRDLGQSYVSNTTLSHYESNPKGQTVLFVGDLSYADNYPISVGRMNEVSGEGVEVDNNLLGPGVVVSPENDQKMERWWMRRSRERIATVVEDPVQPVVMWEQSAKDVGAECEVEKGLPLGFCFPIILVWLNCSF